MLPHPPERNPAVGIDKKVVQSSTNNSLLCTDFVTECKLVWPTDLRIIALIDLSYGTIGFSTCFYMIKLILITCACAGMHIYNIYGQATYVAVSTRQMCGRVGQHPPLYRVTYYYYYLSSSDDIQPSTVIMNQSPAN